MYSPTTSILNIPQASREVPGREVEAAGQIEDALAGECSHHTQDRVTLGPFQRRRLGVLVVFADDVVILCAWLRHGLLRVRVPLVC